MPQAAGEPSPLLRVQDLRSDLIGPWSLELAAGSLSWLSGPSGCGKTLLLRALADLDPHEGRVLLDGVAMQDMPPCEWRRRVALLPTECAWWTASVGEHFAQPAPATALRALGFDEAVRDWPVERLSSGERQRLGLLRALQPAVEVLLLDEASANLDAAGTRAVEGLVAGWLADGRRAALWVSHDEEQMRRLPGARLRIRDGLLEALP